MLKFVIITLAGFINYSYACDTKLSEFDDIMKDKQFKAGGRTYSIRINKINSGKLNDVSMQKQLLEEIKSIQKTPPKNVDLPGFSIRLFKGKWLLEPIGNNFTDY